MISSTSSSTACIALYRTKRGSDWLLTIPE